MAKAFVAVSLLLIAAMVSVGIYYGQPAAESLLPDARKAWVKGDSDQANEIFEQHLEQNPADDIARIEWAKLINTTNSERAFQLLEEVPEDTEAAAEAARELGRLGLVHGDNQRAEAGFKRMIKENPEDFAPALALADLYFKMRRYEDSLNYARKSAELKPQAQTWILVADNLDRLHRTGELVTPLRKAVEADPESFVARGNLAYALLAAAELDEAATHAKWCLDKNPANIDMLRVMAKIQTDKGETEAALETIRKASAIAPEDAPAKIIEADLLLFKKESQAAYDLLIPIYDAHANDRDYLNILARAAVGSGKRDEARKYLARVKEIIDQTPAPATENEDADTTTTPQ